MRRRLPACFLEAYRPRTHALSLAAGYICWASVLLALSLVLGDNLSTAAMIGTISAGFGVIALVARWHMLCRGPAAAYRYRSPQRARLVKRDGNHATVIVSEHGQTQIVPAVTWLFGTAQEDSADVWVCVEAGRGLIVPPPHLGVSRCQTTA